MKEGNEEAPTFFVPNLKWFGTNTVQDGQEAGLECVAEHLVDWGDGAGRTTFLETVFVVDKIPC